MSEAEIKEMQLEEREALISIYEGDGNFKEVNSKTYQYKYGEDDNIKSFLIEIEWTDQYPNEIPKLNLDTFFNRNLIPPVKEKIINFLKAEAEQWLGCGMTYTLFEGIKDKIDELINEQPDQPLPSNVDLVGNVESLKISTNDVIGKPVKKEHLTKSQKRKQWEKTDHKGEKPRGWNWIDIVKHLSQTGYKESLVDNSNEPILTNPNNDF